MSEWEKVRFDQLSSPDRWAFSIGPFGSKVTTSDYREDGVPFIRGVNLAQGTFLDDGFVFISAGKAKEIESALVKPGDIVFTRKGTVGQVSMIPRNPRYEQYAISGSQVKARIDERHALPEFYYYWFRSPAGQHSILEHAVTTGVPSLANSLQSIRGLMVPKPPLVEQSAVVNVLGALDNKIAVNERIAATADTLGSALFHRATLEFPAGFVERPLSTTAAFINGRAFTKDATGSGRMVVRIAEINSGPGASTVYNDINVPEQHLAKPGDVLFAWSGSLTVARWFRPEAIINQHIFKCDPRNGYPQWLINHLVHRKIDEFRAIAADKATTMGHIQRKHLDEAVPVPDHEVLQMLHAEIGPLWDRALLAEQENLALATLRDALLPQLISGRLRVKDAEKIVEGHA
ncbi:restriction endonuclease subunit S [Streptomyces sp. WI04-05B]|uniref:restriction endonuclease subunit S n=1 Tax=Streptomyces TaxID=1883 RepID=UPI0029B1B923|nr:MULTISPECIES: restriction endonuclease subunit S [unclassified Streptomyces]MDX2544176.1 restriction endonuclease subunit S [Streptomyces sp. WI04-05B]MDX2584592.1 restriction endonuclease subunit S [Streptomyces sp. WI04-05A]